MAYNDLPTYFRCANSCGRCAKFSLSETLDRNRDPLADYWSVLDDDENSWDETELNNHVLDRIDFSNLYPNPTFSKIRHKPKAA